MNCGMALPNPIKDALGHLLGPKQRSGRRCTRSRAEHAANLCGEAWAGVACGTDEPRVAGDFEGGARQGFSKSFAGCAELLNRTGGSHRPIGSNGFACEINHGSA